MICAFCGGPTPVPSLSAGSRRRTRLCRSCCNNSSRSLSTCLGFVAIFLFVAFMYMNAYNQRMTIKLTEKQALEARFYFHHYLIIASAGILSIILAWLQWGLTIGLPGWIYVVIGPLTWLNGYHADKKYPELDL